MLRNERIKGGGNEKAVLANLALTIALSVVAQPFERIVASISDINVAG